MLLLGFPNSRASCRGSRRGALLTCLLFMVARIPVEAAGEGSSAPYPYPHETSPGNQASAGSRTLSEASDCGHQDEHVDLLGCCATNENRTLVSCNGCDFTGKELAFTGELIHGIATHAFLDAPGIENLTILNVHGASLQDGIETEAFLGLKNLRELSFIMAGLQILRKLPPGAFRGLERLQRLEIAANRITEIPPGAFETLSSLKELDLRGNSLTNASIASGAFQGLHSLHVLKLDNNEIEDVPVHALRTVTTLVELYVNAKEIQQLGSIVLPG
eukprot:gb/GECG01009159.1/.p1 GENE.gb/GECG01009159.1/~~gb/GECG01009159.1/.p1  ORF type:complete len:275 (+),score=26.07 gb/GECG01009159.1/:1-825(+)